MLFTYIGDKESVTIYDITFPQGQEVEVSDKILYPLGKKGTLIPIIEKLKGNKEFTHAVKAPKLKKA